MTISEFVQWHQKEHGCSPAFLPPTITGPAHAPAVEVELQYYGLACGEFSVIGKGANQKIARQNAVDTACQEMFGDES